MKYISLKEASKLVGKSQKTIQRLVNELKEGDSDMLKKEATKTGRKFRYLISAEYLRQRYNLTASSDKAHDQQAVGSTIGATEETSDQKTVAILNDQLKIKDRQIAEMSEHLKQASTANLQLLERISEGNKLQGNLQLQVQQLNVKLLEPSDKEGSQVEQLQRQLEKKEEELQRLESIEKHIQQLKGRRLFYIMAMLVGVLLFIAILLVVDRL